MKRLTLLLSFIIISPVASAAQDSPQNVTLQYIYDRIEANYPASDRIGLQQRISALNEQLARSSLLPEIQFNASASYQSEVTAIPFSAPGTTPPSLSKDQYNISLDLTQNIYDGGKIRSARQLETARGATEIAGTESELWAVRLHATQVYYGVLQLEKRKEQLELLMNDIERQRSVVQSRVDNGVLTPSNALILDAELLSVQQQKEELLHSQEAAYAILSELIGENLATTVVMEIPVYSMADVYSETKITRPELSVFDNRIKSINHRESLAKAEKLPRISAFARGAYGRPGYNVFENDLHSFWMVGLRAQWSFRKFSNSESQQEVLQLNRKNIRIEEEAFLIGVRSELHRISNTIEQLEKQIELDQQILKLREEIVEEKKNQLSEGTITSTDYLKELNSAAQARLDMEIRKLQLSRHYIEFINQKGIEWNPE